LLRVLFAVRHLLCHLRQTHQIELVEQTRVLLPNLKDLPHEIGRYRNVLIGSDYAQHQHLIVDFVVRLGGHPGVHYRGHCLDDQVCLSFRLDHDLE
jgi:hypothetical protein